MEDVRAQIMRDCQDILESEFRCPLELVAPDGIVYSGLFGRVLSDSLRTNIEGYSEIVANPNITIATESLTRVPIAGEKWIARINLENDLDGDLTSYLAERAPHRSKTIGFVRIHLTKLEQS